MSIQRYYPKIIESMGSRIAFLAPSQNGEYVNYWHHLAAIAAAEQRGRAKGIEEAALVCLDERELHRLSDDPCRMDAAGYFYNRIRAIERGEKVKP